MPVNLHIEVRVALLRNGKTLRGVSREAALPFATIHDVLRGRCGLKKKMPSVCAFRVLRALMPYLPADFAAELRREFPQVFARTNEGRAMKPVANLKSGTSPKGRGVGGSTNRKSRGARKGAR